MFDSKTYNNNVDKKTNSRDSVSSFLFCIYFIFLFQSVAKNKETSMERGDALTILYVIFVLYRCCDASFFKTQLTWQFKLNIMFICMYIFTVHTYIAYRLHDRRTLFNLVYPTDRNERRRYKYRFYVIVKNYLKCF